jgi:SAM-dependent methyltransferase
LGRAKYWRGSPEATNKNEFLKLVKHLKPSSEKDVFFDLGCGYANPCIWIADKVKCSVGFETFIPRYRKARLRVEKSGKRNISIIRRNFERISFKDATIVYSTLGIMWRTLRRINRECKKGTRLILFYEPYPIKSMKFEDSFIMEVPFCRFEDEKEFAKVCFHLKTIDEVYQTMGRQSYFSRSLRWDISHAKSNWTLCRAKTESF